MKKEIFRMINVITDNPDAADLDDMNLHITQGEIVGLIPINGIGVQSLLELFMGTVPIKFGKVYMNNQPFYNRQANKPKLNKLYLLTQQSKLVNSLSVLENIYVLNRIPFLGLIRRKTLLRQYAWLTEDLDFHVKPDCPCEKLTEFKRCIVEILKAIYQGSQLIIIYGISDILGSGDLLHFKQFLTVLARKNYSFLYICSRYEESISFCDRIIYMKDGKDVQSFEQCEIDSLRYLKFSRALLSSDPLIYPVKTSPTLRIRHLPTTSYEEFYLDIHKGECLVLYDETKELQNEFMDTLHYNHGNLKDLYQIFELTSFKRLEKAIGQQIAIIGENPLESMIFYDMSYIDNLCFRMESKLKRINVSKVVKESIQTEYFPYIGDDIYKTSLDGLSSSSLYNLIYYRVALINPKAVFIIQPFYNTDIHLKNHIRTLIHMLQERGISVIILSADLLDSASIANRRLILEYGNIRSEF